jgi:ATP-binding cassette subfamily F protein 3
MILGKDLCLRFGDRDIFDHLSFSFSEGEKVGLVGRNGAGKSTLLKAIAGSLKLDSGTISIERDKRIAYMPQEVVLASEKSVLDEAYAAFDIVVELQDELKKIEALIEQGLPEETMHDTLEHYAHVQEQLQHFDTSLLWVETKKVLQGLGFTQERWEKPVSALSVGWKMRLVLAKLLLAKADFYLFDEPTNHLDIVAKDWFVKFLKDSSFGFLLVSHDRFFLDNVCEYIFEVERGIGKIYDGNYEFYVNQKKHNEDLQIKAYEEQQKEIKKKMEIINKFRASAARAKTAQSMLKAVERMELVELPPRSSSVKLSFSHIPPAGRIVLTVQDLSKKFGDQQIFKNVSFEIPKDEKVAIVAANGVGKTTLLNLISGIYPLEGGEVTMGYNVKYTMFEQDQDKALNPEKTILQEVEDSCTTSKARQNVRSFLGAFLFSGDDVHKKIRVLSGGEKNRVAMVKVLLVESNFLILDEPTNHLDLESKEILLKSLQQFSGTMLFVSHDRTFMDELATSIMELTPNGVRMYKGNYESYLYQKSVQDGTAQAAPAKKTAPVVAVEEKPKEQVGGKEGFELRKKSKNLEQKVEKLEKQLAELVQAISAAEYGSSAHKNLIAQEKELKESIQKTQKNWEEVLDKLYGRSS